MERLLVMKRLLRILGIAGLILGLGLLSCPYGFAGETIFSPGYRVKTELDENQIGYNAVTATLVLPQGQDVSGIQEAGAAYNYLGIETANGNSLEIGVHKDLYDLPANRWSVFAGTNYHGAFEEYGSNEKWHNFRIMPWYQRGPDMLFPDGSTVTMTLRVEKDDEVVFEIPGFEIIRMKMPGANVEGRQQVFRRVTSLMTYEAGGFTKNNRWEAVSLQKPGESFVRWVPAPEQVHKSNNMDENDPGNSSIVVKTSLDYYPEIVDISGLTPKAPVPQGGPVTFKLGQRSYAVGERVIEMDAAPYSEQGRTFIPVRYLAESLGISDIQWDEETQRVTLNKGEQTAVLTVGSNQLETRGTPVTMDVGPQIRDGRVYLPARYVAEAFGRYAGWEPESQAVIIQ
ncbi:copper amine oxidase N-terminal domain-containing protein [Desulforamulus ruminis]|nr:copper amine oxidase N-terminal domain-containing protein [Desulforamulus ruminis]